MTVTRYERAWQISGVVYVMSFWGRWKLRADLSGVGVSRDSALAANNWAKHTNNLIFRRVRTVKP